jgi:hypothetical protein
MTKAKAKPKAPPVPKVKGPSKISRAVEYMQAEIKKLGGLDKLEHGMRKELYTKAAEKFGLAVATCTTQYHKKIVAK